MSRMQTDCKKKNLSCDIEKSIKSSCGFKMLSVYEFILNYRVDVQKKPLCMADGV